jgi:hypothetical protein
VALSNGKRVGREKGGQSWSGGVNGEGARRLSVVTVAAARGDGEEDSLLGNARVLEL